MATAYTEFDCLGSDLLSTIQTAILASGDWARPNSGTFPTLYKATTTRGAEMVIDINAAALTVTTFTVDIFRSHNGTTGTAAARRYLRMKGASAGTLATNTYHGIVSVGKEHFFLSVEGPRASEANPDNSSYGSVRSYIFINDLVPYFPGVDTTPTVIHNANSSNAGTVSPSTASANIKVAYAARNGLNTLDHSPGRIGSVADLGGNGTEVAMLRNVALLDDENFIVWPYVFSDSIEGPRGRLASFFFAGWSILSGTTDTTQSIPPVGQVIEWDGDLYKLLSVSKGDGNNYSQSGAFGTAIQIATSTWMTSPIVAVPYAV
jgi:hypothetical protein